MVMDLAQKEEEALNELKSLIHRARVFEVPVRKMLLRKYPPERVLEAEGKKCVLSVTGLKYHQEVVFLEVTELSIKNKEPFENFDTWIEADISVIIKVLRNLLSGKEDVLSEAFGSNSVKVRGKKTYHDMAIFSEVTNTLSAHIRKFREAGR